MPSILYGAEVIPLTSCTIEAIEKCQAAVAKFILQVPWSTANVVANIDAGFKPISALIAEKVLLYANKVMRKPAGHWAKTAFTEQVQLGPNSSYTKYLLKIKSDNNCFDTTDEQIRQLVSHNAYKIVQQQQKQVFKTTFAMRLPLHSQKKTLFKLKPWVSDSGISKVFARFRCLNVGLGNRGPASDNNFYKQCPLCERTGMVFPNNEVCTLLRLST